MTGILTSSWLCPSNSPAPCSPVKLKTTVLPRAEIGSFSLHVLPVPICASLRCATCHTEFTRSPVLSRDCGSHSDLYRTPCPTHSQCLLSQCQMHEGMSKWMNTLPGSLLSLAAFSLRPPPCQSVHDGHKICCWRNDNVKLARTTQYTFWEEINDDFYLSWG